MATRELTGYQREVAERNAEAILDAAEELLRSQGHVNISAVAVQAGVSRVTVYAHFPTWQALLEAAVERAVRRTMAALQSVRPDDGPTVEALDRMLAAAWQHLASYQAMAAAVAVATGGGIAVGYRHGFTVAAAVAGGLAVVAALLVPAVRPAAGTRVAVH